MSLLSWILLLPLIGSGVLLCLPQWNRRRILTTALGFSSVTFILSLFLWVFFDSSTAKFQYTVDLLPFVSKNSSLHFLAGVDGISLFFIILTSFLIPICILVGWTSIQNSLREYCIAFLLLETFVNAAFSVLDVLLFYIFFESVLIPMFCIIGIWGSRERKIRAAFQFFLYTLVGSLFMLLAVLLMYSEAGTTDLQILYATPWSESRQLILWFAFFCKFCSQSTDDSCSYLAS